MNCTSPKSSDLEVMHRMRLFSAVSAIDLPEMASHVQIHTAERGEILFEAGDQVRCFYGVVSGWVKLYNRREDGTEVVLGIFTQGETFAEAALFMSEVYPAIAETVSTVRLIEFEREYFADRVLNNPSICKGMFASLSMHLNRMTREYEQLQSRSGEQRLGRFLLRLCNTDRGSGTVRLPFDKALIAARLGMKPETLSRSFARLKAVGVKVEREVVHVDDITLLRKHCV